MALVKDKLVDVRVDAGATFSATHYGVVGTANNVRQQYMPASASLSTVDWTVTTPSQSVFVDRRVSVAGIIPFKFNVTNYGTEPYTVKPYKDIGVEAFPFNSLINTGTVQINTSNFTTQLQQTLPLLKRRLREKDTRNTLSGVPTNLASVDTLAPPSVLPYKMGPFEVRQNDEEDCMLSPQLRINGTGWTVAPGATLTCYGSLQVEMEPLLLEPFLVDDDTPGMVNVNVLNVRLNLSTLEDQMARSLRFSVPDMVLVPTPVPTLLPRVQYSGLALTARAEPGAPLDQPSFEDSLRLWVTYLSPPITAGTPAKSIYPYVHYNPLTTRFSTASPLPPFGNIAITSNLITLNVCPDALALYFVPTYPTSGTHANNSNKQYAAPVSGGSGYAREDTVFFPDRLSITWNNNATLLNTLTSTDLQRMTARNGIKGAMRNRQMLLNGQALTGVHTAPVSNQGPWRGTFVATAPPGNQIVPVQGLPAGATVQLSVASIPPQTIGPAPADVVNALLTPGIVEVAANQFSVDINRVAGVTYSYTVFAAPHVFYFDGDGNRDIFTTSTPCIVALNKDLPVEAGVSAGTAGIYTLQVTYETRNFSSYPLSAGTLYVTPIYSQYFTTYAGATSTVDTAVLDEETFARMTVSGDTASSQTMGGGAGPSQDVKIVANSRQRIISNIGNALKAKMGAGADEGGAGKRQRSIMGAL
jgi:hypothetical protein